MAQIASFGVADQYLVGDPEVTMFKAVFRRHTLFAMESIEQTFDGPADFGKRVTTTISKNGDLVGAMWLEITLPDLYGYDIVPTPPDGNTVKVDSPTAGLFEDPMGNYWQTKTTTAGADVYTHPVAFAKDGTYYRNYLQQSFPVVSYNAATGAYGLGTTPTVGVAYLDNLDQSVPDFYYGELPTFPYLAKVPNPGTGPAFLYQTPSSKLRWCNSIGHAILSSVEIVVGGMRIDRHTGEWMDAWSELTTKEEKRSGYWRMIGKYADEDYATWKREHAAARTLYVPLIFCFNTNPGLYLPLIALHYHQIKYHFEFRDYLDCVKSDVPISQLLKKSGGDPLSLPRCRLYADFVMLDTPERQRIAESPHEYLITQVQFTGDEAIAAPSDMNGSQARKVNLLFSHPVKELVWVYVGKQHGTRDPREGNKWFDYSVPGLPTAEVFDECRLVLNGHDRFSPRPASFFRLVQPYAHHTRCPSKRVHSYSFAIHPENHQPSGQANFSRYDTAQLHFTLNPQLPAGNMKIYAYGYNVMRIVNGLAGLAFVA